ncbi:MAG: hypothetical protein NXH87_14140 [Rhodobiaceae bacterium]|nr:hypothetical protein RHODOSMS8_03161 [Rhodobiaceae bacterium]MCR9242514.1 hypothetical protein [Rhodobiaceae bacterium]
MNIFRGYTDGLSASYQVATYQSGSFKRQTRKSAAPRPARMSFAKAFTALAALALKGAQKVLKRRGGTAAPSDFSAQLDLFARPAAHQAI